MSSSNDEICQHFQDWYSNQSNPSSDYPKTVHSEPKTAYPCKSIREYALHAFKDCRTLLTVPDEQRTISLRYRPRIQFSGTIRLLCPNCGHINSYTLRPSSYRIDCKNMHCRRVWLFGFVLYKPGGHDNAEHCPDDFVFPFAQLRVRDPSKPAIVVEP